MTFQHAPHLIYNGFVQCGLSGKNSSRLGVTKKDLLACEDSSIILVVCHVYQELSISSQVYKEYKVGYQLAGWMSTEASLETVLFRSSLQSQSTLV